VRTNAVVVVIALALLTGCGGGSGTASHVEARTATHPATATTARTHSPPGLRIVPAALVGVGNAAQLVSVEASRYGTSYATLRAYQHTSAGWHRVFGPWPARIGMRGFAPPGKKREGDDRTPTGSFTLQFMFGVEPDPGVHFRYRRALTTSWWDDDPASRFYNEWVDSRYHYPGRAPESMRQLPSYAYGVVIGYNTARRPGLGSAIFLHVSHVGATTGCISIAQSRLLALLRWLRPSDSPRIIMGPTSVVTR
jgi:L,D-peptidoglycan transpeptidase YkuD (ErfK/YbiS/YcfS/YnhG family)